MEGIVGRKQELAELERLYHSPKAEFAVVTDRRRVGKTYLIRELFKDRMTFQHTGLSPYAEDCEEKMKYVAGPLSIDKEEDMKQ